MARRSRPRGQCDGGGPVGAGEAAGVSRASSLGRLGDVEADATVLVDAPRSVASVLSAPPHHSGRRRTRGEGEVEAWADVRARLESPGAAAIARREESRQWPRVAYRGVERLGLSLTAPGRSARRSPRGRVAARRVASGRHRSDELNLRAERMRVKSGCSGCSGCSMDRRARRPWCWATSALQLASAQHRARSTFKVFDGTAAVAA